MLIIERQERLLNILRRDKTSQLEALAKELDVSTSTVRRDLETLESQGMVQRTHGGAIFIGSPSHAPRAQTSDALWSRMNEHVREKLAIGRLAAGLVKPNMTVLLDGGSTVVYAARQIIARPIQVVTNSLSIANLFTDDDQVELVLVGGMLYPRTGVTLGEIAIAGLSQLHADLLLFSLAGIYGDQAFNINLTMAQVEQVMMQQAARSVMLMDSRKFGSKSLVRVCGLDDVDQIITDDGVDPQWRTQLGDKLTVAS